MHSVIDSIAGQPTFLNFELKGFVVEHYDLQPT